MRKTLKAIAVVALLAGCGQGRAPQAVPAEPVPAAEPEELAQADAPWTMGKVVADRYADLSFESALPVEQVLVRNGQQVRRGQVLARLEPFTLQNAIQQQERAIEQARLQVEQAQLEMQDVIISQGYDPDKSADIPDEVRHNADAKSGFALSKSQLASAESRLAAGRHELSRSVLTAPFDGVVADLAVQAHQLAQPGVPVCRVIATDPMAVEFRVMEADLGKYALGTRVRVVPVADKGASYEATVNEINPVVDAQGAITLRARLAAAEGLFVGMNVEIIRDAQ